MNPIRIQKVSYVAAELMNPIDFQQAKSGPLEGRFCFGVKAELGRRGPGIL